MNDNNALHQSERNHPLSYPRGMDGLIFVCLQEFKPKLQQSLSLKHSTNKKKINKIEKLTLKWGCKVRKGKEVIELSKSRWWIHGDITTQIQILIIGFGFRGPIFD
jgi:hypothetical protein